MKQTKAMLISLSVLAVSIGWMTANSLAGEGNEKRTISSSEYVVIGHLQSRDRVVTIGEGPNGVVYTIKTKKGKTLAAKITDRDMQEKFPSLYSQIQSGVAGNDATLRPGLNRRAQPEFNRR